MDILRQCLGMIDLTSLGSSDTWQEIRALTEKVNDFHKKFPDMPYPASICIYPNFIKTVKDYLTAEGVRITSVSGAFPSSQSFSEVKSLESRMAAENGADEIDIVLPLCSFLSGDFEECSHEISSIRDSVKGRTLKVILETGILGTEDKISRAAHLAMDAGADFIKTSTGKTEPAATPFAAEVMCRCIKSHYEATGKKVGFKPAGGISTPTDAVLYYQIVESILGNGWLNPTLFRLGASRLANNILSELKHQKIKYY